MKIMKNWRDLEPFGIHMLTGEACGLSMRLLCDLTEDGVRLLCEFFGLAAKNPFDDNMNSGAIASVLLPGSLLADLAAFAVIRSGCIIAFRVKDEGVWGCETVQEAEETMAQAEIIRQYRPAGNCLTGTRCARVY